MAEELHHFTPAEDLALSIFAAASSVQQSN